ncbi:sensor histidine kinase [Streptomyces xantholiticus]|uniref:sensor histidine kinase n=1 Tax=Streptomyces xantholiticus TaxID=68285 RepID=UPI00167BACAF|nr:sensor histidine kinase [Streptomyces xantholiticus]GGW54761.1 two-component sensor histidine kinase [Streptomyces xantholiticus]
MSRVGPVKTTAAARTALRDAVRAFRSDLGAGGRHPLPPMRGPRWLRRLPHTVVVWLAIVFTVGHGDQLVTSYSMAPPNAMPLAIALGGAIVLAVFRPLPAWWLSMAVAALGAEFGRTYRFGSDGPWPWPFTGILAHALVLFLLTLRVRTRVAVEALVLSVLLGLAAETLSGDHPHVSSVVLSGVVFTVAVVLGSARRGLREARGRLVEQEVLTAEERTRRTVLEERSRIARELHDVVAHHMSVISIQAQVAPHLVKDPPEELRENLAGIRQNALDALTELRRVLGVLRSENPEAAEPAPHAPLPTLARLGTLVENARAAGLTVRCVTTGDVRPLTPGVELSAYRIVQEALSNAIRHAPGTAVRIELAHTAPGLRVSVTNTAPLRSAPPSPGAGHGLLGMRERAAMLGGDLAAGPAPDGGYEVTALLPTDSLPTEQQT